VIAHVRAADLHVLPARMRSELPVIDATPETIYDVLREWLTTRRPELAARGADGRDYVLKWHDPLRIAEQLRGTYDGVVRGSE
jgi:hypothetical protein